MSTVRYLGVGLAAFAMAGCESLMDATRVDGIAGLATGKPTISLDQVPTLFGAPSVTETLGLEETELTPEEARQRRCHAIDLELNGLSAALGGPAVEIIAEMDGPTIRERLMTYGKGMAVETVKGYVQPFIQTKRALFNDDEKERRAEEAADRGVVRRAYLIGLAEGIPCDFDPVEPTQNLEAEDAEGEADPVEATAP